MINDIQNGEKKFVANIPASILHRYHGMCQDHATDH